MAFNALSLLLIGCDQSGSYFNSETLPPLVDVYSTSTSDVYYETDPTDEYTIPLSMVSVQPGRSLNLNFFSEHGYENYPDSYSEYDSEYDSETDSVLSSPIDYTLCAAQVSSSSSSIQAADLPMTGISCPIAPEYDFLEGSLDWQVLDTSEPEFKFSVNNANDYNESSSLETQYIWPSDAGAYFLLLAEQNSSAGRVQGGAQFYVGSTGW